MNASAPETDGPATDGGADDDGAGPNEGDDLGSDAPTGAEPEMRDNRSARPEPFEHTFGAQTHPAEQAVSDPTHAHAAPASPVRTDAPAPAPASDPTTPSES